MMRYIDCAGCGASCDLYLTEEEYTEGENGEEIVSHYCQDCAKERGLIWI